MGAKQGLIVFISALNWSDGGYYWKPGNLEPVYEDVIISNIEITSAFILYGC